MNVLIERHITPKIKEKFFQGKAILLFGARQVGKTTLLKKLISDVGDYTYINGDESDMRQELLEPTSTKLKELIRDNKFIFIDEAQRITNIGIVIKLIVDNIDNVQVIASGSSSFELANKINEPLTGRKFEFELFPFSFEELANHYGVIEEKRKLEHRLIFGNYPEIVTHQNNENELLKLLSDSYLFKDIFSLEEIRKPVYFQKILKALALQIGNEVSYTELANLTGCNKITVEKYIDLLEKTFVIFTLTSFSRNVRNEIKKSKKIYFFDNGIRNAVIGNYLPISKRTDIGGLWENYIISERVKFCRNHFEWTNFYFWRTTQKQEIDLIEENNGKLFSYEIKWNIKAKLKLISTFHNNYKFEKSSVITPKNYSEFLLD